MQANLKCDRLEERAFKNAIRRIVRPSSLYSLFIIYERKRHKDLLNILDAFKNVFFLFARHGNPIFGSITMH